jgi:ABC-type transport system substrate-binding protein
MRLLSSFALLAAGLVLGAAAWARPVDNARLYVRPEPVVWSLWFNPDSPLFSDNPQLIQAINYALDRPKLIGAWGRYAGRPTARLIPPVMAGYGGRSPYPLAGADLEHARALAAGNLRSGTALLGVYYGSPLHGAAAEVQRQLAALGLQVEIGVITRPCSGPKESVCPRYDMMFDGWRADYPDPVAMLARLPTFAASRWNARLVKAKRLTGEARARAFAQLDYDVMREAPPLAPFMAANAAVLVSARTHCFRWNALYGVDLGALCVR